MKNKQLENVEKKKIYIYTVLVHLGCCNKLPKLGGL